MKKKARAVPAWARYSKGKKFYFAYPTDRPNTWKLLDTGKYGVVQLVCIDNTARAAFMAGYRAGRSAARRAPNGA